jgi:hypothetical protein
MKTYFAVVPDGQSQPAALFNTLEDAIEWGVALLGSDNFAIRGWNVSGPKIPGDGADGESADANDVKLAAVAN